MDTISPDVSEQEPREITGGKITLRKIEPDERNHDREARSRIQFLFRKLKGGENNLLITGKAENLPKIIQLRRRDEAPRQQADKVRFARERIFGQAEKVKMTLGTRWNLLAGLFSERRRRMTTAMNSINSSVTQGLNVLTRINPSPLRAPPTPA